MSEKKRSKVQRVQRAFAYLVCFVKDHLKSYKCHKIEDEVKFLFYYTPPCVFLTLTLILNLSPAQSAKTAQQKCPLYSLCFISCDTSSPQQTAGFGLRSWDKEGFHMHTTQHMSLSLTVPVWSCVGQIQTSSRGTVKRNKRTKETKEKKRVMYVQSPPSLAQTIVLFFSRKSACVGSW